MTDLSSNNYLNSDSLNAPIKRQIGQVDKK